MPLPNAVYDDARREWVLWRRNPARQFAASTPLSEARLRIAGKKRRQTTRNYLPQSRVVAPNMDGDILNIGKQSAGHSPFLHSHRYGIWRRQLCLQCVTLFYQ